MTYFVKIVFLDGRIAYRKNLTKSGSMAMAACMEREMILLDIKSVQWGIE